MRLISTRKRSVGTDTVMIINCLFIYLVAPSSSEENERDLLSGEKNNSPLYKIQTSWPITYTSYLSQLLVGKSCNNLQTETELNFNGIHISIIPPQVFLEFLKHLLTTCTVYR